jgi:hypothetical protein
LYSSSADSFFSSQADARESAFPYLIDARASGRYLKRSVFNPFAVDLDGTLLDHSKRFRGTADEAGFF